MENLIQELCSNAELPRFRSSSAEDSMVDADRLELKKYKYMLDTFGLTDMCMSDSAPKAVFTIGGPGAGKSYSLGKVLDMLDIKEDIIKIDPDDVLEKLFNNINRVETRKTHINPLTNKLYKLAVLNKKSFISDGTGRDYALISKRVAECKLRGFKTILAITAPDTKKVLDKIKERAAETKREVQPEFITQTYEQLKVHIPFYMRIADATYLFVNTYDKAPVKVITSICGKKECHFNPAEMKELESIIDVRLFCPKHALKSAIETTKETKSQSPRRLP